MTGQLWNRRNCRTQKGILQGGCPDSRRTGLRPRRILRRCRSRPRSTLPMSSHRKISPRCNSLVWVGKIIRRLGIALPVCAAAAQRHYGNYHDQWHRLVLGRHETTPRKDRVCATFAFWFRGAQWRLCALQARPDTISHRPYLLAAVCGPYRRLGVTSLDV